MGPLKPALLQGTLDMLILKALVVEPMHGWGIGERLAAMSGDVLQVPQGSLYPAFVRLQKYGWIRSAWQTTENNRRARYYTLTPLGRRQFEAEQLQWREVATAVDRILSFAT